MKQMIVSMFGFISFLFCFAVANGALIEKDTVTSITNNLTQQLGLNAASVPTCASACAKSLPNDCNGDPKCICANMDWMNEVTCCVAANCAASDVLLTQQFAGQLCKFVGQALPTDPACPASPKTAITTLAKNWVYQGCFTEATNYNRALNSTFYIDQTLMTPDACVTFCNKKGLKFAGIEYGQECWCGTDIQYNNGATRLKDEARCDMPCKGDAGRMCGGPATLNIYRAP